MIEAIQNFAASLPEALHWLGILVISAIPFIDSYLGSVIGIVIGLPAPVAIPLAIVGNIVSVTLVVAVTAAIRKRAVGESSTASSPRREKVRRAMDRYGVAGVALLGPFVLPSQFTSLAMISFGVNKKAVLVWQFISIVIWGVAFGTLAALGVNMMR